VAVARSSLETEVVSIMRALRKRGQVERDALARRLKAARSQDAELTTARRPASGPQTILPGR
jgi:hypothetical protein